MTAQNDLSNSLRFTCPFCHAELAVPFSLAGVEGPCPSCYGTIRAPGLEAIPAAFTWLPPKVQAPPPMETLSPPAPVRPVSAPVRPVPIAAPPVAAYEPENEVMVPDPDSEPAHTTFPPVREQPLRPIPPPVNNMQEMQASVPVQPLDRSFRARIAIRPQDEPLDDSWKARHRDQRRSARRSRRVEKAAHSFLESRTFRLARLGLILSSGAMLAFLFHYLRTHQWRFPGTAPAIAEKNPDPGTQPGKARTARADANELMADDDAEIPPASSTIPDVPRSGSTQPFSGTKR